MSKTVMHHFLFIFQVKSHQNALEVCGFEVTKEKIHDVQMLLQRTFGAFTLGLAQEKR